MKFILNQLFTFTTSKEMVEVCLLALLRVCLAPMPTKLDNEIISNSKIVRNTVTLATDLLPVATPAQTNARCSPWIG